METASRVHSETLANLAHCFDMLRDSVADSNVLGSDKRCVRFYQSSGEEEIS